MASKIDLPGTGAQLDPSDPSGSMKTVALAIVGATISLGILAVANKLWNKVANNTPDQLSTVELI